MKKSKMLLALLVLSTAGVLASCVNPSSSSSAPAPSTSSAPAPSTSSSAPAPSTSSAPAPSTSSSAPAPSTSSSSPVVATPSFEIPAYVEYENVSNWENGKIEANKVFSGEYGTLVATSDRSWTVEDHEKTAEDGTKFTKRLKSGGKTTADGRYISFETEGPSKLVFYAISSSSSKIRPVSVVKDWASIGSNLPEEGVIKTFEVAGDKVARYEVELVEGGTYTIHLGVDEGGSGGINFYQFELIDADALNQKVEIASLKVVGPEEYRVGGEFDPSKYSVYGLSADGKYEHLLEEGEYTLGTIDTTVEKTGENALDLEATYVGFESIKGACEIEVWNWYGITVADDLKALFVVGGGATEFKNGSDIKFTANNPGNILKSVTLTVGGQPKEVTIEDGEFTVEGANGDINLTAASWEAEIVDGNETKIEWVSETELAANWTSLKDTKIPDGTKFGEFTYNVIKDSSQSKYSNKDVPSIQLGGDGKATLSFNVKSASTITVVASATGSSKNTKVSIFKADGTKVDDGETITTEDLVTTVLDIPEAGSYYIAAGASDHLRVFKITCEEKDSEDEPEQPGQPSTYTSYSYDFTLETANSDDADVTIGSDIKTDETFGNGKFTYVVGTTSKGKIEKDDKGLRLKAVDQSLSFVIEADAELIIVVRNAKSGEGRLIVLNSTAEGWTQDAFEKGSNTANNGGVAVADGNYVTVTYASVKAGTYTFTAGGTAPGDVNVCEIYVNYK